MSFLLGMAATLASVYIFLFAAVRIADDAENTVLAFMAIFLFLFFGFSVTDDFRSRFFEKKRKR